MVTGTESGDKVVLGIGSPGKTSCAVNRLVSSKIPSSRIVTGMSNVVVVESNVYSLVCPL